MKGTYPIDMTHVFLELSKYLEKNPSAKQKKILFSEFDLFIFSQEFLKMKNRENIPEEEIWDNVFDNYFVSR